MIDKEIKDLLNEINSVYKGNDWLVIKKYILKSLNPKKRSNFSTRDYLTKKHTLNVKEIEIINFYVENYGIKLEIKESDKHKESDNKFWQRKKK